MHWQCGCCVASGLFTGSVLLREQRGCSGSAATVTQLEKPGKRECWAQVVYRNCQNATIQWLGAFHSRAARQFSPPQMSVHPRHFGKRLPVIPGPSGPLSGMLEWGAVSASQEKLIFSLSLLPGPELAVEIIFCGFGRRGSSGWVKCWRNFLSVWKHPSYADFCCLVFFDSFFPPSVLCFSYCWGCLCSPDNHFWKCSLQSCWFSVYSQLAHRSHVFTCKDWQICRGGPCRAESESPNVTRSMLYIWCHKKITLGF